MKEQEKHKLFSIEYWFYDLVKVTAALPGIIILRPKIIFENPEAKKKLKGGALVVANHVGNLDPMYLQFAFWYRRYRFVCAEEFLHSKGRFFFKNFLCLGVDRENFGMGSFKAIVAALKRDELVCMFPEGHIGDSEKGMGAFKSGMVMMAMQGGKPIVPVFLQLPKAPFFRLVMAIGEPVDVRKACGEKPSMVAIDSVTTMIHDKEIQLEELAKCKKEKKNENHN